MDISWDATQLLAQADLARDLPEDVLVTLHSCPNGQYIDAIASLALRQAFTTTIFSIHDSIFVEVCSRWLARADMDHLVALSVVSRVMSLRPHLSHFAKLLLTSPRNGVIQALASRKANALQDVQTEMLHDLLLSIYRLLAFDNAEFGPYISPAQLQSLLAHDSRPVRYLAVKILCSYLHTSEATSIDMVKRYLGNNSIKGRWEDKIIDYTFLSLWEHKRLEDLTSQIKQMEVARSIHRDSKGHAGSQRIIQPGDLSANSACLGGVLIPKLTLYGQDNGSLVLTATTLKNLTALAHGINTGKPLLLSGFEGCGKTAMIRHAARVLGTESSMVILHLNEQTDIKSLIGMYTNSNNHGSFTWQPGVLTQAVRDGRWMIIEDIDRAPAEILSALLPLLERKELFVPHWGEHIQAAAGFKLIATVRSSEKMRGEAIDTTANLIGRRFWSHIAIGSKSVSELAAIIEHKHPILRAYIPSMMAVYSALRRGDTHLSSRAGTVKPTGPRNVLRWSARVEDLLLAAGVTTGSETISDAMNDYVFLEAVDCFAAAIPSGPVKVEMIDNIARELHMPEKRVEYCLRTRVPRYQDLDRTFSIGRAKLSKKKESLRTSSARSAVAKGPFSITDRVSRTLESVATTVKRAEPCLLVGETGTGKTTIIQRLASSLNQSLTVINLSQQSDAGDLLGGFKPVNLRSLAMPMKEEFDELLQLTFPTRSNQQYVTILEKAIAKGQWSRALLLWQEALQSIQHHLDTVLALPEMGRDEPRMKKRRVRTTTYLTLKSRWDKLVIDIQSFQMYLSNGTKGFAFSFVESNIVKAARNGNWVLLDEINLATSDTLESLGDLFGEPQEGGPSLLLPEKGDLGRVQAHGDFRIFGTMNPATDAGKRDLPANIRSRFTEIFVEAPDSDLTNLVPIVKAYLGSYAHVDQSLPKDIAQLYLKIKKLADEGELADGTGQRTHFSLRTLARTLSYANDVAPVYGLRRALFEGFSMCFQTVLNKPSETVLQHLIEERFPGSEKSGRGTRVPQDGKQYVEYRQYWISKGAMPVEKQAHYVITPFIERNLSNLVRATSTRKFPVLLQGPTSSGKTSMIEHLAKLSGNRYVRINNHEHTDLQEYFGSYVSGPDGRLYFQEGLLVKALKEGHWIVLDELNLAPTDVLEALNRLLDDNRELFIPETQQTVRPHGNFMLFATQNPPGLYGGRKVLSRAFRNRFLELHFDDIPEDELETILRERSQIAPSFCTRIVSVYKELSILRQTTRLFEQRNSFATLRDLFRWALRDADDREQLAANGFMLLAERVRNADERQSVKNVIEEVMKVKIDEDRMYGMSNLKESLGSPLPAPLGVIWTHSMRRLYTLIRHALKHHEPVLLVGETGCGKTTVCQVIAEIMQTKLHMVNAHQNMETGDLIGSQRPIRDKHLAQSQFSDALIAALEGSGHSMIDWQTDLETLTQKYETLIKEAPDSISDQVRYEVERSRTKVNALFEWADGSLVQAMREGQHYLLDEISLADDSVLERLNSVLEPGRSLLLAEKGSNDVLVTASSNFEFLATMNPGGDYGKRELSPALRNRFTEIWVPRTVDEHEMLEIVQAKLASSKANLAQPMVTFAAWYASNYKTNAAATSLRDLLTWTTFIKEFEAADPGLAVLHGAAMVYLDRFGTNPTAQMSMAGNSDSLGVSTCLQKLSDLFHYDMTSVYQKIPALFLNDHQLDIGDFSLNKRIVGAPGLEYSLQAPTTKINTMKVIRALQLSKPILLEGSPGVGKTTLVSALAKTIGMPLTRINLSEQTDLMDLFGSDVPIEGETAGHFGWRDAPFLRAMQKGEWVLLDEMNLASQTVLEGLNACLDHRGQVYIPELDRTFSRHANFVVFAAQNPHLQGGGRKGLPESFVNRFTVVYAQALSKQDLLVICSELFPEVSNNVKPRLVECLTRLNSLLQSDTRLEVHGGPWEFNLRDILRWLKLLTSRNGLLALAEPADFAHLLFVQRFRTAEDQALISKVIAESLLRSQPQVNHYHAHNPWALQVGFALLSKNRSFRGSIGSTQGRCQTDFPIAEALMICVQESWPCLLVGASGSGKTAIINHLAASVGAELIQVSLNSDMDTMDLVGGFEQLDTERKITGFVKRVKAYARKAIVQQMIACPKADNESLLRLEAISEANLADLLQMLQTVAQCIPSSECINLLAECRDLERQLAVDKCARFEWVDGIVIEAVKQGKWLVLDNANLCSPSVLDRLNSLLEPDGSLCVNEHRDPDGRAQIVEPHPDFRLFLTMDPRYGELSRAMRNRSLELFLPNAAPCPDVDVFGANTESTVSRFQYTQSFQWAAYDETLFFNMISIFLEHLSFADVDLCNRWQEQATLGLINLSASRVPLFHFVLSVYQDLLKSRDVVVEKIRTLYGAIGSVLGMEQDLSTLQSIHPFNSPILLSTQNPFSKQLQLLGHCFDLLVETEIFRHKLDRVTQSERSVLVGNTRRIEDDTARLILSFLHDMSSHVSAILSNSDLGNIASSQGCLEAAKELMTYLDNLLELVDSGTFDKGAFHAYRALGLSLTARMTGNECRDQPTLDLAAQLASKLDSFKTVLRPYSGLAMEKLWAALRPPTAISMDHLQMCLDIEGLGDRFDALKWNSGASLHELDVLHASLVAVNATLNNQELPKVATLENLKKALEDMAHQSHLLEGEPGPYFRLQFEALAQIRVLGANSGPTIGQGMLDMLAGKPTKLSMAIGLPSSGWATLAQVFRLTALNQGTCDLAATRQVFPSSVLNKLCKIDEVPLRSLHLLIDEVKLLSGLTTDTCGNIGNDPAPQLQRKLREMRSMAAQILRPIAEPASINEYTPQIASLSARLVGKSAMEDSKSSEKRSQLVKCATDLCTPSPSTIGKWSGDTMMQLAEEWIQFFAGLLLLYVPDQPIDPVLLLSVEREHHKKRKGELQNKLNALQVFEKAFSGQQSNYRIHILQDQLELLGAAPETPLIPRPATSQLSLLQGEFNNILKSIVLELPNPYNLGLAARGGADVKQELELLRMNIAEAISRLSVDFRAYDDITKPVVAMLTGLDIGLSLAVLAETQSSNVEVAIAHVCEMTPFLGATPSSLANYSLEDLDHMGLMGLDARPRFLQCVALLRDVGFEDSGRPMRTTLRTFQSFYQEWERKLEQDRNENALNSSLYRYRGSQEDEETLDELGFIHLFPTYENSSDDGKLVHQPTEDPKHLAQRLSRLHREIFQTITSPKDKVLRMIENASSEIANLWSDDFAHSTLPVTAEKLVAPLILGLEKARSRLQDECKPSKLYNFYTDANVLEAHKVVGLVGKVQAKFRELQETWPEHATLENVLKVSHELLSLRHSEPVAKILTKTEQLHSFVHQWQVVASREFNVTDLYDSLSGLIVRWRRLELSTWGRLLDMEDKHCIDESDSWWFIAYQVIIAVPMSMIDSHVRLEEYAQQLLELLGSFLATTSLGQYTPRLEIIKSFESHIALLSEEHECFGIVRNALANFLRYHHRFDEPIKQSVLSHRQTLETSMKEIVLLASWKDTNIVALRDSARRSHHKLFKVVRKYRALLAEPAESILKRRMADPDESVNEGVSTDLYDPVGKVDPRALELCQQALVGWSSKPPRQLRPDDTARIILRMSQPPSTAMDGAAYLNLFATDLIENIRNLQKETPAKSSEGNVDAIKHLKSRKRHLFSETLKAVRLMGFRSNIGADVLKTQDSIEAILTRSPYFRDSSHIDLARADHHFDLFLNIMPQARQSAAKHSEDLTNAEALRSVGYLESILFTMVKQRATLALALGNFRNIEKTYIMMDNLWKPEKYTICTQDAVISRQTNELHHVTRWLPTILDVSCTILEAHSKLGETTVPRVLHSLRQWHMITFESRKATAQLPLLPWGISTTRHIEAIGRHREELEALRVQLRRYGQENPNMAYIFKQIEIWTKTDQVEEQHQENGVKVFSVSNVDASVSKVVDSILVALQQMSEALSSVPCGARDVHWLLSLDLSLSNSLKGLHSEEVERMLRGAMAELRYLDTEDPNSFLVASAICGAALPIVQQYMHVQKIALERYGRFHLNVCRLASTLAKAFTQIAEEGFCNPPESFASEGDINDKSEGGTGLGEGEGADDISKDVQDDEDLSDLAQRPNKEKESDEMQDQDDAVDMDHDEMEGGIEDAPDRSDGECTADGESESDMDEETGDVDDLDSGAVDERLWDGKGEDNQKQKQSDGVQGKTNRDEMAAAETKGKEADDDEADGEGKIDEPEVSETGDDEGEEMAQEEGERMDPHVEDGQHLDLPEEMELDNMDKSQDLPSEDDEMDKLSDGDHKEGNPDSTLDDNSSQDEEDTDKLRASDGEGVEKTEQSINEGSRAGSPTKTEQEDGSIFQEDKEEPLVNHADDAGVEADNVAPSDTQGLGNSSERTQDKDQAKGSRAQGSEGAKAAPPNPTIPQDGAKSSETGDNPAIVREGRAEDGGSQEERPSQAFKKLGDALKEWHRQHGQIQDASNPNDNDQTMPDNDDAREQFEHLGHDQDESDIQALGAASKEQARPLDDTAVDSEMQDEPATFALENDSATEAADDDESMADTQDLQTVAQKLREQSRPGAFAGNRTHVERESDRSSAAMQPADLVSIEDLDNGLSSTSLQPHEERSSMSGEEARQLWSHYEAVTRDLSLSLTERLRLILAPTLATRMRGDFRTGKRLNIKRIIPYIASNFKRDKIWMRRSIPSKRTYQIMLAVDDSKSMSESESGQLAYQTLALIAKSLLMLEAGEICIVGFGNNVFVAHDFDTPFSAEAGATVVQRFNFQQEGTNIRKLVAESIKLFRQARSKSSRSGQELWQLELIISDGVCEDHKTIKKLVRQATEERIMIVFVIVDALLKEESIMDMRQAIFEPDGGSGEARVQIKRYMDDFPFTYYLVVGNVGELPGVLAQALRQWFAEVSVG